MRTGVRAASRRYAAPCLLAAAVPHATYLAYVLILVLAFVPQPGSRLRSQLVTQSICYTSSVFVFSTVAW